MNRIKNIVAAAAVGTAVVVPATAAVAVAEPYPWHGPSDGASQPLQKTKAQIEYEERIGMQERCAGFIKAADPDVTDLPWVAAGALGAGALAAGGVAVTRRFRHEPGRA